MVLQSRTFLLALLAALLLGFVVGSGTVTALPGFNDHTGPSELTVTEFERLDTGCADDVATYSQGSLEGGNYTKVTFIETGNRSSDLSAWVERTSPIGADLSTFRVHVDAQGREPVNESCQLGTQYRITVSPSGGSPAGLIPDAHGTRVLWLENGRVSSCSASVTSPLDDECHRFLDRSPARTWANASLV